MDKAGSWKQGFPFGTLTFIREETRAKYEYPLTEADVASLLNRVPPRDLNGMTFLVFRQPTWKMERHAPRWAAYQVEHHYRGQSGPAIFLEATDPTQPLRWTTSLRPEDQEELRKLEREGHEIMRSKKEIVIGMDIASTRNTLRRSLLHEVGHHVDYMRDPEAFDKKSHSVKESFAEKYAAQYL